MIQVILVCETNEDVNYENCLARSQTKLENDERDTFLINNPSAAILVVQYFSCTLIHLFRLYFLDIYQVAAINSNKNF